jgi:hypothetical protein
MSDEGGKDGKKKWNALNFSFDFEEKIKHRKQGRPGWSSLDEA